MPSLPPSSRSQAGPRAGALAFVQAWAEEGLPVAHAPLDQLPRLPDLQCAWLLLLLCTPPVLAMPSARAWSPKHSMSSPHPGLGPQWEEQRERQTQTPFHSYQHGLGHPHPCIAEADGAALYVTKRCKHSTYPELAWGGPQRLLVGTAGRLLHSGSPSPPNHPCTPDLRNTASAGWAKR